MLTCRAKWLKENADRVREYKRRSASKAYKANPSRFAQKAKAWRQKNNQWARQRDAIYRLKYAENRKSYSVKWRSEHRDYYRKRHGHDVNNLAAWYVRAKLSRATCIKPSEWPASLVELMRANLKVKRLLWQHPKTSRN